MDELLKQALNEYFSDYKEYHLIILICFVLITLLIQTIHSICISRKIERFKNDLKKSEIKFSRYNEMQIKALSELYEYLSTFHRKTINVGNQSKVPEKEQKNTQEWLISYYKLHTNFSKNKFILTKSIKNKISETFRDFEKMKSLVSIEKRKSSLFYTDNNGEVILEGDNETISQLTDELKNLDRTKVIQSSLKNINDLKLDIEIYFENLE